MKNAIRTHICDFRMHEECLINTPQCVREQDKKVIYTALPNMANVPDSVLGTVAVTPLLAGEVRKLLLVDGALATREVIPTATV